MKSGPAFRLAKSACVHSRQMRVGLSHFNRAWTQTWPGSEYVWSACAAQLLQMGHDVLVFATTCVVPRRLTRFDREERRYTLRAARSGRLTDFRNRLLNPYRRLSKRSVDLMVVSSGSAYDPAYQPELGQFLLATGVPFLFVCHFNAETLCVDRSMRDMMAAIFQRAKATVFVSRDNQRLMERQLAMAVPRDGHCSAADSQPVRTLALAASRRTTSRGALPVLARLEPLWKGQDVLFGVLAGSKWQDRNYTLSLFGHGADEKYLRKLSRFYGLENRVAFAGFADPAAIWSEHHLQVLATRGEGGPIGDYRRDDLRSPRGDHPMRLQRGLYR